MEGGPLLEEWWVEVASKEFVPYLNISSQLPTTPDQNLLQRMGGRGYPYFVVLDDNGSRIVPGRSFSQFRPMNRAGTMVAVAGAQELIAARANAAAAPRNPALAANRVLLERLLLDGKVSTQEAAAASEVEGIDPTLAQRFRAQEVLAEYAKTVGRLDRNDVGGRQAAFDRAGRAMLAAHKQGTPLNDTRLRVFGDYWRLVFTGALLDGELVTADKALAIYRRVFGTAANMRERISKMTRDLDAAKKERGESNTTPADSEESTGS